MEEYKSKVKSAKKSYSAIGIIAGILIISAAILCAICKVMNWQVRSWLIATFFAVIFFIAFGCIIVTIGLIWAYFSRQDKMLISKIIGIALITIMILGSIAASFLGFIASLFVIREERVAIIDDRKYIARTEYEGLETTGISYHEKHGIFYEKHGYETEYNYEVWNSYK